MDKYAVLVFHGQNLTDEQHLAFTRALGPMEQAIGSSLRGAADYRLPTTFADVSNLDKNHQPNPPATTNAPAATLGRALLRRRPS